MCATFQLGKDDIEEIHRIEKAIDDRYGEGSSQEYLSKDFFPKQRILVIGPGNKVSLLTWGFPLKNSK